MELLRKQSEIPFGEEQLSHGCAHSSREDTGCAGPGWKQKWQQLVQKPLFLERRHFLRPTKTAQQCYCSQSWMAKTPATLGNHFHYWKGAAENGIHSLYKKLCSVHYYTREQGHQPSKLTSFYLFSSYSQ